MILLFYNLIITSMQYFLDYVLKLAEKGVIWLQKYYCCFIALFLKEWMRQWLPMCLFVFVPSIFSSCVLPLSPRDWNVYPLLELVLCSSLCWLSFILKKKIKSGSRNLGMKMVEIAVRIVDNKNESGLGSKAHWDSTVQPVPALCRKLWFKPFGTF